MSDHQPVLRTDAEAAFVGHVQRGLDLSANWPEALNSVILAEPEPNISCAVLPLASLVVIVIVAAKARPLSLASRHRNSDGHTHASVECVILNGKLQFSN
ncbi:unnamed protein product [Soboliphyme baturini]|uniref:DUF982 domain-containing protein n=1 Tax=Soboliphyme baturini TaxID=241478 RepID=A0A183IHH9_9BILA|nr:unnamed protein product [Soboliphyme baturini]